MNVGARRSWNAGVGLAILVLLGAALPAAAEGEASEAKTLSPYFLVPGGGGVETLPLEKTSAEVRIAGVIAEVTVRQVYRNGGDTPIEAVYVFPASTRAAVGGLEMRIGDRIIVAEIQERARARATYESAVAEGRSATLLEQDRPNVFTMRVGNVMPGDRIEVTLRYTELLVPENGVYEFVYPTVVGPRYSAKPESGADPRDRFVASPYLHAGEKPTYALDIDLRIEAGVPIRTITSPSHAVTVRRPTATAAEVALDASDTGGGNRDVILRWGLRGDEIATGLLLFQDDTENFFLLTVQPPERIAPEEIPPREYLFIVDISGSMHGFPLDVSKALLRDLLTGLRPVDRFNVLLFAGSSNALAPEPLPATPENVARATALIDNQSGCGGTEILDALRKAYALPRAAGMSRSVVVVTDGYVCVEPEAFEIVRRNLGRSNLFAFGIGSSVNRHLIEGMARAGMGEPAIVTSAAEAAAKADAFRRMISTPALVDVEVSTPGFDAYDVVPGRVPDLFAERPLVLFGKWRGERGRPSGHIVVRGRTGGGAFERVVEVAAQAPDARNAGLRALWARHRIAELGDLEALAPNDSRAREITDLGLAYRLLTAYTSFVAVDYVVRNESGAPVPVRQPLPMPQGVSDYAVGFDAGGLGGAVTAGAARFGRRIGATAATLVGSAGLLVAAVGIGGVLVSALAAPGTGAGRDDRHPRSPRGPRRSR